VCSLLLAIEQDKKIHDYERRIIFKYDVIMGSTFVLFMDGKQAGASFPSWCNVVVGNDLVLVLYMRKNNEKK